MFVKQINDILFVTRGLPNEETSLKQAMSLLINDQRTLHVAIIYPKFPKKLLEYLATYENTIINAVKEMIARVAKILNLSDHIVNNNITIDIKGTKISAVRIVQRVLLDEFDLLIKSAEVNPDHKGFKSIDLTLLRQCPCPVWLCHPRQDETVLKHIAVAIDPEDTAKVGADLAEYLLKLSSSLSKSFNAKLSVISCWDSIFDERMVDIGYLGLPQKQAAEIIHDQQQLHLSLLNTLIEKSGIDQQYELQHLRGSAATVIPQFLEQNSVDLLIMGTVGRTGISGFIIGNTAENIMNKLSCSLLALKPHGFASHIKAY